VKAKRRAEVFLAQHTDFRIGCSFFYIFYQSGKLMCRIDDTTILIGLKNVAFSSLSRVLLRTGQGLVLAAEETDFIRR
jgi:hypothetical protein